MNRLPLLIVGSFCAASTLPVAAGSLQTQSNEVTDGTIVVDFTAEGDRRLGWEGINPYTPLDVDVITPVLGFESISVAHDSDQFFFRLFMDNFDETNPQQSFFGAHHTIFIDADQDRSTGYIGDDGDPLLTDGFLPIGADYLIQGPALFRFGNLGNPGGANQELFSWGGIIPFGQMIFDDGPVSDIELQIDRSQIGDPTAFDFIALTDTDPDFVTQDIFPNNSDVIDGDFFTYSTIAVAGITGDYNDSGQVEQGDLDLVLQNWGLDTDANGVPTGWTNDLPSGQIEQTELDGVLQNWGNTAAPDFSGSSVPEPASLTLLAGLSLLARRRRA